MQRELSRFTHRADKQQQAGNRHQRPLHTGEQADGGVLHVRQIGEHISVTQAAAEIGQNQTNAQDKAEVADAVHQKGFQVGENRAFAFEIETDQQVRHQAYCFPTEKQLDEVVAHHQHQHRESKQRDVAEEALVAYFFIVHIADGVNMYHQRYTGHHHHHHGGEAVYQKADREIDTAHGKPGIHVFIKLGAAAVDKAPQHKARQYGGNRNAQYGNGMRTGTADLIAEQTG